MAMRAAAVAVVKPRGLRRLFCTQTFVPSRSPPVEPSTQLLVTDLSKRTTSDRLKEAFSKFGVVVDARVVTDRLSGYSKGYGFVRYETIEEAAAGIKGMDGQVSWQLTTHFYVFLITQEVGHHARARTHTRTSSLMQEEENFWMDGLYFAEYERPGPPRGQAPPSENDGSP